MTGDVSVTVCIANADIDYCSPCSWSVDEYNNLIIHENDKAIAMYHHGKWESVSGTHEE